MTTTAVQLHVFPCQTLAQCLLAYLACEHQHHIISVLRSLCPFLSFSDSWLDMSRTKNRQPLPSISKGHKAEHGARANAFPFSARRANICSPLLQHPLCVQAVWEALAETAECIPGRQQLPCAKCLPSAIASAFLSLGSRGSGGSSAEMRGAFRGPFSRLKHFPLCSPTHQPLQRCGSVSRDHTVEAGVWHQDTGQRVGEGFSRQNSYPREY